MSVADLLDHVARVRRRTEDQGARLETVATYDVPSGLEEVPCTFTRRRTILADRGTGLQPVGQRTVYVADVELVFADRDIVEVYEGPDGFQGPMHLEVVSIAKPRGNHTELLCEEFAGSMPEVGS